MSKDEKLKKRKRSDESKDASRKIQKRGSSPSTSNDSQQQLSALENAIADGQDIAKNVSTLLDRCQAKQPVSKEDLPVLVSLCKVFTRLMVSGIIPSVKNAKTTETPETSSLRTKYEQYHTCLQLSIREANADMQVACLKLSMRVLKSQAEHLDENIWVSNMYSNLMAAIIEAKAGSEVRSVFINEYFNPYEDCKFYSLEAFSNYCDRISASEVDPLVDILSSLRQDPASADEADKYFIATSSKIKKKGKEVITTTSIRRSASAAWLAVLSSAGLTIAHRKRLLGILVPSILPWLTRPETLFDFLTTSFDQGESLSLLSLAGIYHLITTKNLDYPSFYSRLYGLLTPSLMHSKHRSRFLRHLNIFLSSSHLPATLVASFIKRLARLCLYSPPAAIVAVVPHIYNLLKSHPQTTFMIHRTQSIDSQDPYQDPFDASDSNPLTTRAIDSSLWELHMLASSTTVSTSTSVQASGRSLGHYHPNVSSICQIISLQFTKQQYNTEDFLDHSYSSMLDGELKREVKKEPVIEWKIPKRIFTTEDLQDTKQTEESNTSFVRELWNFG